MRAAPAFRRAESFIGTTHLNESRHRGGAIFLGGAIELWTTRERGCAGQAPVSPLPVWARSGFHPANLAMPYVMGEAGNIVAILWAPRDALHSPPLQGRSNKILWASKIPLAAPYPLVINATLADSTRTATVSLPGVPGLSIIDLPAPGLLDPPPELVRPHRRTRAPLRGLTGS
jgi:hypothetical protein